MCPLLLGWTFFESGEAFEGLQRMGDAVAATRHSAGVSTTSTNFWFLRNLS